MYNRIYVGGEALNLDELFNKLKYHQPSILGENEFFKSAILIPFVEVDNEIHLLFEVRSMNMKRQPGDVCFPGGRIDKEDLSPAHCAIRETTEELGITPKDITDVTPLDYVVSDMGRIIYPFVGKITSTTALSPNPDEVGEVFTVPLEFFLQTEPEVYKVYFQVKPEENFPYDLIVGGKDYEWQMRHVNEHFYKYNGKVIWGLTARILNHLLKLLK